MNLWQKLFLEKNKILILIYLFKIIPYSFVSIFVLNYGDKLSVLHFAV